MKFYDVIKKIAKEKKISINEMEKELGLSKGSVCKWNIVSPSAISLKKVADYMGVELETLYERSK